MNILKYCSHSPSAALGTALNESGSDPLLIFGVHLDTYFVNVNKTDYFTPTRKHCKYSNFISEKLVFVMILQEAVLTVLEHPDNNLLHKKLCG